MVAVNARCLVRTEGDQRAVGGMPALATRSGWRPGRRRLSNRRRLVIEHLNAAAVSNREIARRLGVDEKAIRKQVGPAERPARQQQLPLGTTPHDGATATSTATSPPVASPPPSTPTVAAASTCGEEPETTALTLDVDPANRVWDRLLAAFGLLDDAPPIFGKATALPGAGVLCALLTQGSETNLGRGQAADYRMKPTIGLEQETTTVQVPAA